MIDDELISNRLPEHSDGRWRPSWPRSLASALPPLALDGELDVSCLVQDGQRGFASTPLQPGHAERPD